MMKRISFSPIGRKDGRIMLWLLCLLMFAAAAMAPGAGPYEISRYTIDSGGGTSSGGPYTVTGTIGQPDSAWSIGGKYELFGGFWPGGLIGEGFENYGVFNGDLGILITNWKKTDAELPGDCPKPE